MDQIKFLPLASDRVSALRSGGHDAYDCAPERTISDGAGNPCRHCLDFIPKGAEMSILAYRPLDMAQPYARTGPIILCAEGCEHLGGWGLCCF